MTWLMKRRQPDIDLDLDSWEPPAAPPAAVPGPKWSTFDPDVAAPGALAVQLARETEEGSRRAAYDDCERCGRHLGAEGECGSEWVKGCGAPRTRCRFCGTRIYPRAVTCREHSEFPG